MGMVAPPSQVSGVTAWTEVGAWVLLGQRKESVGQVPVEGGIPLGEC